MKNRPIIASVIILVIALLGVGIYFGVIKQSIADYKPRDGYMEINLIDQDSISYTYELIYILEEEMYSHDCGMFDGKEFSYSFTNFNQGVYNEPLPSDIQINKYFTASSMDFGVIGVKTKMCSGSQGYITTTAQNPFAECKISSLNCQPGGGNCMKVDCNYNLLIKASQPGSYVIGKVGKARVVIPKQGIECLIDLHCDEGQECLANSCVDICIPQTCEDIEMDCGVYSDGCLGSLNCGTCSEGNICSFGECVDAPPQVNNKLITIIAVSIIAVFLIIIAVVLVRRRK